MSDLNDRESDDLERFPELRALGKTLEELVRDAVTIAKNKQALLRFQKEVFNGHDWSIETLSRHLTPDFVDHAAMPGDLPGLEGVQSRFSAWQGAFADAEEDNIEMAGEGDMLAVLYNLHARHTGDFLGIPATQSEVVIPGIEFLRFREGKIAEHWGIYDFLTTAEEIGADLGFTPRDIQVASRRPEVPWSRKGDRPAAPVAVGNGLGDGNGHSHGNGNGSDDRNGDTETGEEGAEGAGLAESPDSVQVPV
jgi:predicted ester cyclase